MTAPESKTPLPYVTAALEARQNATDAAKRIIEDGYAYHGGLIVDALSNLNTAVVTLERALTAAQAAKEAAEREVERLKTWQSLAFKMLSAVRMAFAPGDVPDLEGPADGEGELQSRQKDGVEIHR